MAVVALIRLIGLGRVGGWGGRIGFEIRRSWEGSGILGSEGLGRGGLGSGS